MDIMSLIFTVWIYLSSSVVIDATFLNEPVPSGTGCFEGTYNFPWSYSVTPNDALSVVWRKDGLPVVTWVPSSNQYVYGTGYDGSKVEHNNNNGDITIKSLNSNDTGVYICRVTYATSGTIIMSSDASLVVSSCPTSEMSTYSATERTTSVNSIFEFSNITIAIITGSISPTSEISASTKSFLNTGTTSTNAHTEATNVYSNTETTHLYTQTETSTSYLNTENTNLNANTETYIQTKTLRIVPNSMSTYQSMFVTTVANDISGSFDTTNQIMTETFTLPGYSISSYNEILLPSTFETSNLFLETLSETSMFLSVDTLSNTLFNTLHVSSGFLITTDSSKYSSAINTVSNSNKSDSLEVSSSGYTSCIQQIITNTESPLMSSTFIDHISNSSKMEDPSFLSYQYLLETTETLPKTSVSKQLTSAIINTMNIFLHTTNTLTTSYLDDTGHSFDDFTDVFQTFSHDHDASASTSLAILFQLTDHHLSLKNTECYETMQTEFKSYVTKSLYDLHTDNATTGIYSKELMTSGKSYMHTNVMQSQTQLASMKDIQDSTTPFQSTYFEPYSLPNDEGFSSEISQNLLSTLLSTSVLLAFNTQASASEVESYMETTNMMTFESQSGIQTKDLTLLTNPSSIQISAVSFDFKPTLLTTAISFNSKTMPSMIKPSSKQTNSGVSYIEIESSFKDSLFSLDSFSGSVTSNDQDMTSLSSGVYKPISTLSTNTIQSELSEKSKTIIFITTTSVVIAMIFVILLIIFSKVYMSTFSTKSPKIDDKTSWSNNSCPPKTAFPDYSFTGKSIYPLLNTSSVSFKMSHYEQHWNDLV